ncbi:membrane protein insertion efficiency factor YidD [bacterium]|nr:membrane protein insertion efficiency factor YidD [bacterium]
MMFEFSPEVKLHQTDTTSSRDSLNPFEKSVTMTEAEAAIMIPYYSSFESLNSPGIAEPFIDLLFFLYGNIYGNVKGDSCLFYPTCSHYSRLCIRDYSFLSGLWMTCGRLVRAHVNFDGFYPTVKASEGIRYLDLPQHERFEYYRLLNHEFLNTKDYKYAVLPEKK